MALSVLAPMERPPHRPTPALFTPHGELVDSGSAEQRIQSLTQTRAEAQLAVYTTTASHLKQMVGSATDLMPGTGYH